MNKNRMPIPGISVKLTGTSIVAIKGAEGRYMIKVPAQSGTLVFTYIGYKTRTAKIGAQSFLNVLLSPEIQGHYLMKFIKKYVWN